MKGKKRSIVRVYNVSGGLRLYFLVKGQPPPGFVIAKAQSKNPKHKGMKLLSRVKARPANYKTIVCCNIKQ